MWPRIREWALRWRNTLWARKQLEQEFEDELTFHRAMREEQYAREGMTTAAAERQARLDLGTTEKWKEALRDVRRPRLLEDFVSDARLALRLLRKSPGFTAVALITLTLAIGANTAVFTLLDTLLFRPLPVPQADRLVMLRLKPVDYGYSFNYPVFRSLEKYKSAFSAVFGFQSHRFQMRYAGETEDIPGVLVTGKYFSALGVPPESGRWIYPSDDQPEGGPTGPVAVVSDRFWRTKLNGTSFVLGRKLTLDKVVFTIVGVMPNGFRGVEVGSRPDVFVPLALEPMVDAPFNMIASGWHASWIDVGARLREGVSLDQANTFLRVASKPIFTVENPYPNVKFNGVRQSDLYIAAESGATGFSLVRLRFTKPLFIVMALVVAVLIVACLNLAGLLLARSTARERELATRFALGAKRSRLLQQLLTESLLIAIAGTALGFAMSFLASQFLVSFLAKGDRSLSFDIAPDIRVFAFVSVAALSATVLIGILPALRSTGRNLQDRIKDAAVSLRAVERHHLWPRILMGNEVALALALVTGAGLLGYSFVQLHDASLGFAPNGVTVLPLEMLKQQLQGKRLLQFYQQFDEQLTRVPAVVSVSYASLTPISGSTMTGNVQVSGQPARELHMNRIGPRYFATMGTPLIAGREFRWSDTDGTGAQGDSQRGGSSAAISE